jgi:fructan beta-fructosidase
MGRSIRSFSAVRLLHTTVLGALLATLPMPANMLAAADERQSDASKQESPIYSEAYRPQFHFTPQRNWMNDPNGLVQVDGEYHLFYQYNPFGDTWGHMSWGHATSPDRVHWHEQPLALAEENGGIFSGSVVVDAANTSGFGKDGNAPLVAAYTGYRPDDKRQAQYIAYSNDRGRTWTKYAGNPVVDIGSTEFRDPKIIWHAPTRRWIMAVALAAEHKVRFYGSVDLKQWTPLSDFGPAGAVGGVWECPDLFELPVDGKPGQTKWVLVVNLNPGGVARGSGAQYFLGSFDGTRFIADDDAAKLAAQPHWIDYGADFYAVASWSDTPSRDGRQVWIAWMNNWEYGEKIPTSPWRSAQSLPREVHLKAYDDGIRLTQTPIRELQQLRGNPVSLPAQTIRPDGDPLAQRHLSGDTVEIVAVFEPGSAREFGLAVRKGKQEETRVGYDVGAGTGEAFIDRTHSGRTDFSPKFAARHSGSLPLDHGRVTLHVFVDRSSVEAFGNDGRLSITDQIFPGAGSDGIGLYAKGGDAKLISLDMWPLKSIWK